MMDFKLLVLFFVTLNCSGIFACLSVVDQQSLDCELKGGYVSFLLLQQIAQQKIA